MPELPEISVLCSQMGMELVGKEVESVDILQPKNLNVTPEIFKEKITSCTVASVIGRGKWIFIELSGDSFLLINLGMGGDLLHFEANEKLERDYKFRLNFYDGSGFTINFWWFGYIHLLSREGLKDHKMTKDLGLSPLDEDFTQQHFRKLVKKKKGNVKNFLLNQRNLAGIGNVYIQDILFEAKIHPNRKLDSLATEEVNALYDSTKSVLSRSLKSGGLAYEKDFYGKNGGFSGDDFLVGYKTGKPCPKCATTIEKIKTGSTSSYICSECQRIA